MNADYEEFITCPSCGYADEGQCDYPRNLFVDGASEDFECSNCDAVMIVEAMVSHRWMAELAPGWRGEVFAGHRVYPAPARRTRFGAIVATLRLLIDLRKQDPQAFRHHNIRAARYAISGVDDNQSPTVVYDRRQP